MTQRLRAFVTTCHETIVTKDKDTCQVFTSRPYTLFKEAASASNNTSTFIEEIQRYECLYNKLSKDYKKRRTRENVWETIGQKFGLTAEAVPKTDAFFDVLSSSSSQNITANQITSQKSPSSIDSRHFNFDLGGKKFLLPVFLPFDPIQTI